MLFSDRIKKKTGNNVLYNIKIAIFADEIKSESLREGFLACLT